MENMKEVAEVAAVDFVKGLVASMQLEVDVQGFVREDDVFIIDINGKDVGMVIGRRGETLDNIQYLASVVAGNVGKARRRMVVDAEGYRERRNETLVQYALKIASRVLDRKRPEKLESMNSFERLMIHKALSENEAISTRSEGVSPRRYIVIEPKGYEGEPVYDPYSRSSFNRSGAGRKPRSFGAEKRRFF